MPRFAVLTSLLGLLCGGGHVFAQEPCSAHSERDIPGIAKDVGTHTTGAQDWRIPASQATVMRADGQRLLDWLLALDFVALAYWRSEVERAAPVEIERTASTVTIRPPAEQQAEKDRQIEQIQSSTLSESAKKARLARFLADYRTDEQLRDEAVARQTALFEARRTNLAALEARFSGSPLDEPAVVPAQSSTFYGALDDKGWTFADPAVDVRQDCYPNCRYGQHLVTLNESYYDTRLPRSAPQVFVVTLGSSGRRKDLSPGDIRIRDESLDRLDLDGLARMLPR